jgi:hypothetical protein
MLDEKLMRYRLDPRYYDADPQADKFVTPTTYEDVDELFVTEEFQRYYFLGLTSWSVPPLNSVLSFWDENAAIMGGHRRGNDECPELWLDYMAERIEVDESTWLPFFRKDRWYDLDVQNRKDIIKAADETTWQVTKWSVDDDRIWVHLRVTLEIANRILKALIQDNNEW